MNYDYDEECWLRTLRRNMFLLCVIYPPNRKLDVVTEEEIRNFMSFLEKMNPAIYRNIVKPHRPLEYTLKELLEEDLIITNDERIGVNGEKIRSEKDLKYWENIGDKLEMAFSEYARHRFSNG